MLTNGLDQARPDAQTPSRVAVVTAPTVHNGNHNTEFGPAPAVYAGICQVAKAISHHGIAKAGRNQQQGYSFRGIDQVMNALSGLLADADLCILPRMREREQEERATAKGGTLFYVTVKAEFTIVSSRDGSRHTISTFGEAMDSGDKATNKAMSAAYKYAVIQAFCIPLEGQPDADETTHQPRGSVAAAREVAQAKIAAMRKTPQLAVAVAEQIPEPHEEVSYEEVPFAPGEESQLEAELRESIEAGPQANFTMLRAFNSLKARYEALGMLKTYYGVLGLHGVRHANGFETIMDARACYRDMLQDVTAREARMK